MRAAKGVLSQLKGMNSKVGGITNMALAPPSLAFMGVAATKGVGKLAKDGTVLTNPWFYRNQHSGYGKRGIDSNTGGADGLVSGLYNKRRRK